MSPDLKSSSGWLGWVFGHVLRHPLTWLWIALSAAAWPAILLLAPQGITSTASTRISLIYEVAFIGLTLGTLVGGLLLERGAWFLAQVGPIERLALELGTLLAASLVLTSPGLVPPLVLSSAHGVDIGDFIARTALCQAHLSALMVILLRLPLPTSGRLTGLLALTWVLPAIVNPATLSGRFVTTSLNASQYLVPRIGTVLAELAWKEAFAPIMGMLGAALLLRPPPLIHALRNPR